MLVEPREEGGGQSGPQMNEIKQVRFEALAAYCRQPGGMLVGEEIAWYEAHDEAILIVIVREFEDGEFGAILLARDLKERYRWVEMTKFFPTLEEALAASPERIEKVFADFDNERSQGDEKGKPVDFFTHVVPTEKLNKDFASISTLEGYTPAVEIMKPMMRWYEDADGNFIEQFQTTGFDTRLWELYMFAALVEAGCVFDKSAAMPDFCARSLFGELCVEATTVNPSRTPTGDLAPPPPRDTKTQHEAFLKQYMPIRYAGPLTTKLAKKYWERDNVKGRPLAFAIQDFHAPGSMVTSRTSLPIYLYGQEWAWNKTPDGELIITPQKVKEHVWGTKTVPSGFFSLPGSENVSAVIANASATISKFDRIGVIAGFGSKRVRLTRRGTASNPDSNSEMPVQFIHDVNAPDYAETWMEGMDVYRNPNARHPLDPPMLPGAAHHRLLKNGQLDSLVPQWQPFASYTLIEVRGPVAA